ncbi:MAG: hypothetical protein R3B45_11950 [Bdellovibrionota bacterium]
MSLSEIAETLSREKCSGCENLTSCHVLKETLEWLLAYRGAMMGVESELVLRQAYSYLKGREDHDGRCLVSVMSNEELCQLQNNILEAFHSTPLYGDFCDDVGA